MAKPSRPEPHPRKSQPVDEESCAEPSTERLAHRPGNADQFSRWGRSHPHRCATRSEITHRQPRRSAGTWSAGQFSRWGPPTGIARERETSADDAAPCQREFRTVFHFRMSLAAGTIWTGGVPARDCIFTATGRRSAFPCADEKHGLALPLRLQAAEMGHRQSGGVATAEAVVDVDDGDPRCATVEQREQRGEASPGSSVPG